MPKPQDNQAEPDEIDLALFVTATYGTLVLGTKDQEHYIQGFKHSQTYKEARASLEALLARREAEAISKGHWQTETKYTHRAPEHRGYYGNVWYTCNCGFEAKTVSEVEGHIKWQLAALNQHTPKEG